MDLFVCFVVGWRVDGQSTDEKGERERDGRRQQEWTCCPKEKKKTKEKWGGITLYRRRRRVDIDVWPVCCS
jgi:hypothetical protein